MNFDLRALVFDFDGLLVDTETLVFECWRDIYLEHGLQLELCDWQKCVGTRGGFDPLAPFVSWDEGRRAALRQRERDQMRVRLEGAAPRAGVRELLEDAAARGLSMAVASSSDVDWVERWLSWFDIRRFFGAVCTGDEVEQVKPHPALYRLALQRLGVACGDAVALEDSLNGAAAARAAGMRCVICPNPITESMPFPDDLPRVTSLEGGVEALLCKIAGTPTARSRPRC